MIPAYALLRRSTTHQDLSISDQRAAITAWAAQHGYAIVREFADDGSGLDTAKRREFTELLQVCSDQARREADVVLCYDVSRFSRLEPDEAAWHEHGLRRVGVRVLYTHDAGANDDGLTGHLVKAIKRAGAHDYSLKLSQVVTRGLRSRAAMGQWTGGRPPYGYRRGVRTPDGTVQILATGRWKAKGELVTLVPDPAAEAAIVREIFDGYVHEGRGLTKLAWNLNARAVPVPTVSRRQATSKWTKVTLWSLLRNPIYIGTLVYAKARYSAIGKKRGKTRRPKDEHIIVEHAAPPIVPRELWDAAQAKHGTRAFGVGRAHQAYLLSGMIVCSACGRRFRGHRQLGARHEPYNVYVCGSYQDSGPAACDGLSIRADYLEAAVIDGIQKRLDRLVQRDLLAAKVRALLGPDDRAAYDVARLEEQDAKLTRRLARLVEAVATADEVLPSVRAAIVEHEGEREHIARELVGARARRDAASAGGVETLVTEMLESLGRVADVLAQGDTDARRAVIQAFLDVIRIEKGTAPRAITRWHRMPKVGKVMLVELKGEELDSGSDEPPSDEDDLPLNAGLR